MEHHAVLMIADSLAASAVPIEYRAPGVDVVHVNVAQCGIDEARELTTLAGQTALSAAGRTFVIVTKSLTMQAQNALLKLFEEPPAHCQFYLIVPSESVLLPTLRSRLALYQTATAPEHSPEVTAFFAGGYKERLEEIVERVKAKDEQWIDAVITTALKQHDAVSALPSTVLAARHYRGPGAAKKMLLEELALALPPQITV